MNLNPAQPPCKLPKKHDPIPKKSPTAWSRVKAKKKPTTIACRHAKATEPTIGANCRRRPVRPLGLTVESVRRKALRSAIYFVRHKLVVASCAADEPKTTDARHFGPLKQKKGPPRLAAGKLLSLVVAVRSGGGHLRSRHTTSTVYCWQRRRRWLLQIPSSSPCPFWTPPSPPLRL